MKSQRTLYSQYFFFKISSVQELCSFGDHESGLGGLVVNALDFQAGYHGFESRSGGDNFQTIITPNSYSTCTGLSIKWTGRRLVTDSGTKCAWMIHESKYKYMYIIANAAASMCLGCLVVLKIRTTKTTIMRLLSLKGVNSVTSEMVPRITVYRKELSCRNIVFYSLFD